MSSIVIQDIGPERLEEFFGPIVNAMGMRLQEGTVERWRQCDEFVEQFAALDGDRVVGTSGAFDFTLSVPGGYARTAGLTLVAVMPSHRRRGIMRRLVDNHLRGRREQGAILSALWASEAQIYGRFGYGMAGYSCHIDIEPHRATYAVALPEPAHRVVHLLDAAHAAESFPRIWDAARARIPGMLSRSASWWRSRPLCEHQKDGPALQFALLELSGQPAAYAVYRIKGEFDERYSVTNGTVKVIEAIGATALATRAMWRYLLDIDLVGKVQGWRLPIDHPLVHTLEEPRRLRLAPADGMWLRVLDVQAALAARTYATDADITLAVTDDLFADNNGCFRVSGADNRVERVPAGPDIQLDVAALGCVYLGGFSVTQLVDAGRVQELTPGAAARADTLFHSARAPWCPEVF